MNQNSFCTNCGESTSTGDKFCQKCGTELSGETLNSESEISKKKPNKKMIIAVIALVIVALGSVTGYSIFAKSFTADKVIANTLSLESGKINLDYFVETGWGSRYEQFSLDFMKNKEEKTFLVKNDYDETYLSIKDGKVFVFDGWYEDEFDLKNEIDIDTSKLEKDLINYLADTFKGKKVPKSHIENMEKNKLDGSYVVTFDVANESGLIGWIYDAFDFEKLKNLIAKNIGNKDAKEEFEYQWDHLYSQMNDSRDYLDYEIGNIGGLKTSVRLVVDKKGIVDEIEVKVNAPNAFWGEDIDAVVTIFIDEKNKINRINRP